MREEWQESRRRSRRGISLSGLSFAEQVPSRDTPNVTREGSMLACCNRMLFRPRGHKGCSASVVVLRSHLVMFRGPCSGGNLTCILVHVRHASVPFLIPSLPAPRHFYALQNSWIVQTQSGLFDVCPVLITLSFLSPRDRQRRELKHPWQAGMLIV